MSVKPLADLLRDVQAALDRHAQRDYSIRVVEDAVRQEDDWWYVPVTPSRAGVRAHEYAELLTRVENELSDMLSEKVLLIPTFVED